MKVQLAYDESIPQILIQSTAQMHKQAKKRKIVHIQNHASETSSQMKVHRFQSCE